MCFDPEKGFYVFYQHKKDLDSDTMLRPVTASKSYALW